MWQRPAVQVMLPFAVPSASLADLRSYIRDLYELQLRHAIQAGSVRPLVMPYALLGTFVLPVLYLSFPHARRPWLFRARLPLLLLIVAFNMAETLGTSSVTFHIGYGVGLIQAWGILWSATLLLWMNPQLEAERVQKRKKQQPAGGAATLMNGDGSAAPAAAAARGENGDVVQDGHALPTGIRRVNGNAESREEHPQDKEGNQVMDAPDEDIARSLAEGYEYYWQAYPADEPFLTRLAWSTDLVTSFRGTGWNWGIPILPHFAKPEKPLSGALVDLNSIPLRTRQGFRRFATRREWLRAKFIPLLFRYLALDVVDVLMKKDPYYILGPEFADLNSKPSTSTPNPLALPPFLAALPPPLLTLYRSLISFSFIFLGIQSGFLVSQFYAHFSLGPRVLGVRAELWHHPTPFGAFTSNVLDRGLAGFWGGWWHQTFRAAFAAPSAWLARRGYIDASSARGRAVASLLAFAQSAFLHTLGSISCLPPTRPWLPSLFFMFSLVGVMVQTVAAAALRRAGVLPRWATRAGNFAFVCVWLVCTQHLLNDDLGRAGIYLLDPVPFSFARLLGLGGPGESPWRLSLMPLPRWYQGRRWWQSGMAF